MEGGLSKPTLSSNHPEPSPDEACYLPTYILGVGAGLFLDQGGDLHKFGRAPVNAGHLPHVQVSLQVALNTLQP